MRNDRMWNRKFLFICTISLIILLFGASQPGAETATSVSQDGITFQFNKTYEVGKFANGDYWVLGPATITRITPDYDGSNNGWEVNPVVSGGHGFQNGCKNGGFNSALVPSLPYTSPSSGIVSIVKTIANVGVAQPCIKTAVVLTVVTNTPPGNGATVFRPPYVGTSKPYYSTGDLRTDLLPSLTPVGTPPSLSTVASNFRKLRLDHKSTNYNRSLRPADSMYDYQPENSRNITEGILRLMFNDSVEAKMPALIQYVQAGIDAVHAFSSRQIWFPSDGHETNHITQLAFTATMLDMTSVKTALQAITSFHPNRFLTGETSGGDVLWGETSTETGYWTYLVTGSGNRAQRDPYGYIDGGDPGWGYANVTSQSYKGEYLAAKLMPSLQSAWPNNAYDLVENYIRRWVEVGAWTKPDPCAPYPYAKYSKNWTGYGVTWGPDPKSATCILGSGRFPGSHGVNRDSGQYRSAFVAAMWNAYMGTSPLSAPQNIRIQ